MARKKATPEQRRCWRKSAQDKETLDPERKRKRKQAERQRIKNNPVLKAKRKQAERLRIRSNPELKAKRHAAERLRIAGNPVLKARVATAENARRRRQSAGRPFIGVDGEGAGEDTQGRQNYMLLRAGERELFTGKPLSTWECLDFLCDCPPSKHAILAGFSFGYDVTMILRDLPSDRRVHLLNDKPQGAGRYTYWSGDRRQSHGFGIEYLKGNYFRVCRTILRRTWVAPPDPPASDLEDDMKAWRKAGHWEMFPRAVKGSSRTVYETFGFFQDSFLKTLKAFDVGTVAQRAEIEANKAERGDVAIGQCQRDYCALECVFLAELMEQFRSVCLDPAVDIRPRTWNGAGKLSSALHETHATMTASALVLRLADAAVGPTGEDRRRNADDFLAQASAAYYGGRFEVTRTGAIDGPVWEYDIHSAYPAAMEKLPCLEHGKWWKISSEFLSNLDPACHTFVAPVRFDHHAAGFAQHGMRQNVCGLPVRQKSGRLFWPVQGAGVYWSCEIAAAARLGCQASCAGPGWLYEKHCDCRPFEWVRPLYEARKALGADMRGHPIKLAINGLYGKLAQRVGNPKFANLIWAGLITALTRAELCRAAASDPEAVVMFATDALFTLRPLAVDLGDGLGQWEGKEHARLFIVQPGIYWGASRPKMRGVPDSVLTLHVERFESAWSDYRERDMAAHKGDAAVDPPVVPVPIRLFTGIRIAQARGKPETAGRWTDAPRNFDFDWHAKRGRHEWHADHVWTWPAPGGPDLWSRPHGGNPGLVLELDEGREELQEQPDAVDLSPPYAE